VSKPALDPNVRAAALELERTLGTRVKILGDGHRGKIEISYFSAQDLNRIYDLIVRQ
jgi:ParB family chromosome partitioning protein